MKKDIYSSHTEIVIDKDYSERKVAKVHFGRILICIAIEFIILSMNIKNSTKDLFLISLALSWFTFICVDGMIGEYKLNKRIYPYTLLFTIVTCAGTVFALLCYYGVIGDGHVSPVVVVGGLFGALFATVIIYIIVRSLMNTRERSVTVSAVCIDNLSSVEQRFANNMHRDKIERARSVAYAGDYVTLYTPVFRFDYNGTTYEVNSNVAWSGPLPVGSVRELRINPKKPTEISVIFKKENNQ